MWCQVIRSVAPVTQNHLSKPEDRRLQMQTFSGNQRSDLLTALMNMSLVLRLPRKMHLSRSSSNVPRLPSFLEMLQNPLTFCSLLRRCTIPCACRAKRHLNVQKWSEPLVFLTCWLRNVLRATTACTFSTSQLPKVVRERCVLTSNLCLAPQQRALFRHLNFQKWSKCAVFLGFFTCKCASHHNGVHFFDIASFKRVPKLRCFVHFDLEMCFAPQRRAIFHLSSGQLAPRPL